MKEAIFNKLTSRKFWVTVIGVITGVLVGLGADGSEITRIAGLVASAVSAVTYVISEAIVDKAAVETNKEEKIE